MGKFIKNVFKMFSGSKKASPRKATKGPKMVKFLQSSDGSLSRLGKGRPSKNALIVLRPLVKGGPVDKLS